MKCYIFGMVFLATFAMQFLSANVTVDKSTNTYTVDPGGEVPLI